MAYQQEPHSVVWAVHNDGQLAGLTYNRLENVVAWHRHIFGGKSDTGKLSTTKNFFYFKLTNVSTSKTQSQLLDMD